eukprot:1995839-Rhodomonas_salina.1
MRIQASGDVRSIHVWRRDWIPVEPPLSVLNAVDVGEIPVGFTMEGGHALVSGACHVHAAAIVADEEAACPRQSVHKLATVDHSIRDKTDQRQCTRRRVSLPDIHRIEGRAHSVKVQPVIRDCNLSQPLVRSGIPNSQAVVGVVAGRERPRLAIVWDLLRDSELWVVKDEACLGIAVECDDRTSEQAACVNVSAVPADHDRVHAFEPEQLVFFLGFQHDGL